MAIRRPSSSVFIVIACAAVCTTTWIVVKTYPYCEDGALKTALTLTALVLQWVALGVTMERYLKEGWLLRCSLTLLPAATASAVWFSQWVNGFVLTEQSISSLLRGYFFIVMTFGLTAWVLTVLAALVSAWVRSKNEANAC